mgnify:CR=1 FL=1
MFNQDFYPTSQSVLELMHIDCENKIVLEPSAGKGNIVEFLKLNGAQKVIACEENEDLAEIIKTKCHFLKRDFLQVASDEVSHINMIVMNPPFSAGVKHVLHAWEVAPDGCEIISLINQNSLDNDYSQERKQLLRIIQDNGSFEGLGEVFTDGERKTNASIGLIRIFKPGISENNFAGFFIDEEPESQGEGMMRYDAIRDVVMSYVGAIKCFDEHSIVNEKMNRLTAKFDVGQFGFTIGYDKVVHTKEEFAICQKHLQTAHRLQPSTLILLAIFTQLAMFLLIVNLILEMVWQLLVLRYQQLLI